MKRPLVKNAVFVAETVACGAGLGLGELDAFPLGAGDGLEPEMLTVDDAPGSGLDAEEPPPHPARKLIAMTAVKRLFIGHPPFSKSPLSFRLRQHSLLAALAACFRARD